MFYDLIELLKRHNWNNSTCYNIISKSLHITYLHTTLKAFFYARSPIIYVLAIRNLNTTQSVQVVQSFVILSIFIDKIHKSQPLAVTLRMIFDESLTNLFILWPSLFENLLYILNNLMLILFSINSLNQPSHLQIIFSH